MARAEPIIRTVCGDIRPAELGRCYGHEHLLGQPPAALSTPDLELTDEAAALAELARFRQAGGGAIVEMTTPDYGRDAAGLRRLSEQSGVQLIAATGYNKEKFSAPYLHGATIAELTERFIQDVIAGMDGTDSRAGLIKASSTLNEISPDAEKLFRAAARAHHATGAPISTHTEAGTMALEQVALLQAEGVAPGHIIIGHTDRKLEWLYHLALAQTGVYLGFDQISKEKYYLDALRADFITRLVAEGHGQQILLGGDLARRSYWPSYGNQAGPGLTYILTTFVPLLRQAGLSSGQVDGLLRDNPARAFAFVPR
jgi:phosphotriesterase-related protein